MIFHHRLYNFNKSLFKIKSVGYLFYSSIYNKSISWSSYNNGIGLLIKHTRYRYKINSYYNPTEFSSKFSIKI
jgi:hypothetical protein